MLQKLNKKKTVLIFILSLIILFGGWLSYQAFVKDRTINGWAGEQESFSLTKVEHTPDTVALDIEWRDGAFFAEQYLSILDKTKSLHPQKEVILKIDAKQSQAHPWWLKHSAVFIEAVSKQEYTQIESILKQYIEEGLIHTYSFGMNNELVFIYIEPTQEEDIYIVLTLA